MHKKIIALAVVAAFSTPAFADVTPYGIIDAGVVSISGTGQKSDIIGVSGGLSTSRVGLKISEDLGDGLTAAGVLEYSLDAQTSDTVGSARQEYVALAGGFGTVASGYLQTAGYDFGVKFDPVTGSSISPQQNVTKTDFLIGSVAVAARAQRAVAYISPNIGGLTVAVNYSTAFAGTGNANLASTAADAKVAASLLSATYTDGPLTAAAVYAGTNNATGISNLSEYALGASYDLGVAKVMGTYQTQTTNATASKTHNAYSLSAVVPVGGDAVAVTYAANKLDTATDTNGSSYSVGYLRNLSKTTTAYAAYSSVTNGAGTNKYSVANNGFTTGLSNGGSSSLIAVGLRKKF